MSFTVPSPDKSAAQSIPAGFRPSGAPLPGIPAQPAAATRETLPAVTPDVNTIFDTPIETLLAQYRVTLRESQIRDREFYGAVVVRGDRISLLLSPDRSEFERDFFTRYLICQALGVDMTPLPEPFAVAPLEVTA
ncbi:hypothetical protein ACFVY9_00800 [Streptomyces sp. NPDC059544]|uniref:hypothetical protein n=1 Tax=Streptomyces sp. NPDC059544 TaxID=3346861 RepID=UPI0036913798